MTTLRVDITTSDSGWVWWRFYDKLHVLALHTLIEAPATQQSIVSAVYYETIVDGHTIEFKQFFHQPIDDLTARLSDMLQWISTKFPQLADGIADILAACPELGGGK